jgi:peptidoglycan/LPS O-acetylase OafA/YrhL
VNPLARLAEFVAGMLAYRMFSMARRPPAPAARATLIELATILAVLVWLVATQRFAHVHARDSMPIFTLWVAMTGSFPLFAAMLVVFARGEGAVSRALAARPLVYLGEISFAVYMTHHLILTYVTRNLGGEARAAPVTAYLLYWAVTLVCSAMVFELLEKPARRAIRARLRAPRIAELAPPLQVSK